MVQKLMAVLVGFGLLAQDAAFARQAPPPLPANARQVELAWNELGSILVEQKISTVLAGGVKLQGEVLAVRPDSLVLDVQKSSRKALYPQGQTEIPRSAVGEVKIIRQRSPVMRIIGGIAGTIGGLALVSWLAFVTDSAAVLIPGLILAVPLSAVGGYYAGKLADTYTITITIRPDGTAAVEEQEP
jgi:hypothetical protein